MRIHIRPVKDGVREYMVVPGRGAHMAPVLIRGRDKESVLAETQEVVAAVETQERRASPRQIVE